MESKRTEGTSRVLL